MSISVIIPNWNGRALLEKHLPAVIAHTEGAEVIVVDDCSTDDSLNFLKKNFPAVVVLKTDKHTGFSSAVNIGVNKATGDIVILLNTDVEPEQGFLAPLQKHFSEHNVFAVGCLEKDKNVLRGRGLARWEKGFFIHSRGEVDKTDTAWVSGGSGAFRKDLWQKLGGMDTLFDPFYWEDIDLSYRARKAGYTTRFEPNSIVHHFHDTGSIKTSFSDFEVRCLSYRNQFLFIWKNLTDPLILFEHVFFLPIRLSQSALRGDFAFIKGLMMAKLKIIPLVTKHFKLRAIWKKSDRSLDLS